MDNTKSFRELIVWQKAHALVIDVYKIAKKFPQDEIYALTQQLRRAAVSIPANIVEGYKKKTKPSKLNYLNISEGSLEECKYYFILSCDLEYITQKEADKLTTKAEEVGRILNGYYNSINNSR
ncbi:MAG: four helix bundle protein [Bacteroidia bacterium]|nr:four helix bundle protein [Bacteroidia bacterium]